MSQLEDINAINDMFRRTKPQNATSSAIRSSFISWFDKLTSYNKSSSPDTYKEAVKRRDAFFKADTGTGVSPAKPATTQKVGDTVILLPGPRPTLREGIHKTQPSYKPYVVEWQTVVKALPDGAFGPATKGLTKTWQKARGLADDGVVGPISWGRAQLESSQAAAAQGATLGTAAAAAVDQLAAGAQQAQQAAASQSTAAGKVEAVSAAAVQSVATAAAQAANVLTGKPPTAPNKPPVKPGTKPTKPSTPPSKPPTISQAVTQVQSAVNTLSARTPVWVKALGASSAVLVGLIGFKVFGSKKRAA